MKITISLLLVCLVCIVQAQNIGLNVDAPSVDIHMKGEVQVDDSNGNTIMKLYENKNAFRVGTYNPTSLHIDSVGLASFSAGLNSVVKGDYSFGVGSNNNVSGQFSFAAGFQNTISGLNSYSLGSGNTVLGDFSGAYGLSNHSEGGSNFLAGFQNNGAGDFNSIFGIFNSSEGNNNFMAGAYLISDSYLTNYLGRYNKEYTTASLTTWVDTDPLVVIGNGSSSSANDRSNALVVLKNGKVGVNVDNPSQQFEVNGNVKIDGMFMGDGSQLTNLPDDGHWQDSTDYIFNNAKQVGIGTTSEDHQLAIKGDKGMLISYTNSNHESVGQEIVMTPTGETNFSPIYRTGQYIDIRQSTGSNIGSFANIVGESTTSTQYGFIADIEGQGNTKYGLRSDVEGAGNNHYGGWFEASEASINNIGVFARAYSSSGSEAIAIQGIGIGTGSLAGQFTGNVEVEGDLEVTENLEVAKKVAIGSPLGLSDLSVIGDGGVFFNYTNPPSAGKALTMRMLSPGKPTVGTSSNAGIFLDLNLANKSSVGAQLFVRGDSFSHSHTGLLTDLSGPANYKTGISANVDGFGFINIGGSFTAKDGAVDNIAVKAVAEGANGNIVAVYAEATGPESLAGEFKGNVDVSDLTTTSKLSVGPTGSTTFSAMQGGTYLVGADNTPGDQDPNTGIKVISVIFNNSFPSIPKLLFTASTQTGQTYNDAFSVTTRNVTVSGCTLIIKRVDSDASWSQDLRVDYFGFSL